MKNENAVDDGTKSAPKKSIFSVIWKTFTTVVVALFVLLAILLVGVRFLGLTPYAVLSGSMTPAYNVGTLVYVRETDPSEIGTGDVISFVAGPDKTVVTHRVARTDRENGCFYTKGDANISEDANPVIYENVLGTVRFSIPLVGYVSILLSSASGRYIAVATFLFMCFVMFLPDVIKTLKKH